MFFNFGHLRRTLHFISRVEKREKKESENEEKSLVERLKALPLQSASKNGAQFLQTVYYQPNVSEKIARNWKKNLVRIKRPLTFAIRSKKRYRTKLRSACEKQGKGSVVTD
ncbi:MAG: hypothetical protein J7527_09410, partial [Chitinophagaceae bacterium]|nr:hypothetical protein [Chitinophagaceae bacterium]